MNNFDAPRTSLKVRLLGGLAGVVTAVALMCDTPAGDLSDAAFDVKVAAILIPGLSSDFGSVAMGISIGAYPGNASSFISG